MGWGNPVVGGTVLLREAIQSPNFVQSPLTGWAIDQNGNAFFQNITVGGGSGLITVFTQAATPTALHIGDIWINTTSGSNSVNVWNGSAWVLYQFGSGALGASSVNGTTIATGTITAANIAAATITGALIAANTILGSNIAAGTITAANIAAFAIQAGLLAAGAIDAHTFNQFGNQLGGIFAYNATPGPLNTDPYFLSGISSWSGANGGTPSYSSLNTFQSPGSMLITPSGSNIVPGATQTTAVTAGTAYGFTCLVVCPVGWTGGTKGFRIVVNWLNNVNGVISTITGTTVGCPAGTQVQCVLTGTAPAGAVNAQVFVEGTATPTNTTLFYVQQVVVGQTGSLGMSVAAAAGTDQFGDPYKAGLVTYANDGPGNFIQQLVGLLVFGNTASPDAAHGAGVINLQPSGDLLIASGTSGGNVTLKAGLNTGVLLSTYADLSNVSAPAAPTGAARLFGSSGQLATVNPQGLALNMQGAQSDLTAFTVTQAAFTQFSKAWSIPAGDAVVGATYRLRIWGNGTQGSTAQNLNIALSIGGTAAAGAVIASSFAGVGGAFSFYAELEVTCVTTGTTGTFQASKFAAANASTAVNDTGASTVTVNTTIANSFEAVALWASTTGAPTITCRRSVFERVV